MPRDPVGAPCVPAAERNGQPQPAGRGHEAEGAKKKKIKKPATGSMPEMGAIEQSGPAPSYEPRWPRTPLILMTSKP